MNKHYKKEEQKRKEKQFLIGEKLVDSYGSIFGENKCLQKSKHKRHK